MAESFDDAEFWLRPQFLADDDETNLKTKKVCDDAKEGPGLGLAHGFGSDRALFMFDGFGVTQGGGGVSSDLSSPVGSVVGSSEAESDEEDFLAGLTLQMARSTLQDDDVFNDRKKWNLSGSPQSTLCAPLGSRCGCEHGSSRGSPNGSNSRVSSPPPVPSPTTWELLSAAAGEVAKIRSEEEYFLHNHGFAPKTHHTSDFHKQLQASQYEHMRQQQILKQQQHLQAQRFHQMQQQKQQLYQQKRYQNGEFHGNKAVRPLGLPQSAWPPLQRQQQSGQNPQNGSGMRAVFLGNQTSGKRECAGTGVFLPRQVGAQPETRRKQACSTVLLPARVVQALNLNLDDMCGAQPQVQPRFNGRFVPETVSDVTLRLRNGNGNDNGNNVVSYQKRNARPQQQVNHEIRLPQDWTY